MSTGALSRFFFFFFALPWFSFFKNLIWHSCWEIGLTLPTGGSSKVHEGLSVGPPPACRENTAQYHDGIYSGRKIREGLSLALQHPPFPSLSCPWQHVSHVGLKLLPQAAVNDECRSKNEHWMSSSLSNECLQSRKVQTLLCWTLQPEKFLTTFVQSPALKRLEFS